MSDFSDEKRDPVDGARDDAVSTAPFLLAQATPGGGGAAPPAPRDPRVKPPAPTRMSWEALILRKDFQSPADRDGIGKAIE